MDKIINDLAELIVERTGVENTPVLRSTLKEFIESRLLDWYTKKDILQILRDKQMPSTWANFKSYEDFGLLPTTENAVLHFHRGDASDISKRDMPIYTNDNIEAIIVAVEKIEEEKRNRRKNK
jgi:hypothetical protein